MKKGIIATIGVALGVQSNAMPERHLLQNQQVFIEMEKDGSIFVLKTAQAQANMAVRFLVDNGFTNFKETTINLDQALKSEKSVQIDSVLKSIFGSDAIDIVELDDMTLSVNGCV
jgi:rhodanese-related sulfurtransferase